MAILTPTEPYVAGIEHSAQILEAAGFDVVPLLRPIAKSWDLLGVSPHGLILVTVVRGGWPEMLGLASLGVPPHWPVTTLRLIHRYADDSTCPAVRIL